MTTVKLRGSADLTPDNIDKVLKRYKSEGHAVDPENESHRTAYVQLRMVKERINGEAFAKFLAKKKDEIQLGGSSHVQYYGVPKTNFPGGLPEDLRSAEVPSEDLVSLAKSLGSTIFW